MKKLVDVYITPCSLQGEITHLHIFCQNILKIYRGSLKPDSLQTQGHLKKIKPTDVTKEKMIVLKVTLYWFSIGDYGGGHFKHKVLKLC